MLNRKYTAKELVELMAKFECGQLVEVIRCKDCERHDVCRTSNVWAVPPPDDWYCADGERKET